MAEEPLEPKVPQGNYEIRRPKLSEPKAEDSYNNNYVDSIGRLNSAEETALKLLEYKDNFSLDQKKEFSRIDQEIFDTVKKSPNEPFKVGNVLIPPEMLKEMTNTSGIALREQMYNKALNGGSLEDITKMMNKVKKLENGLLNPPETNSIPNKIELPEVGTLKR